MNELISNNVVIGIMSSLIATLILFFNKKLLKYIIYRLPIIREIKIYSKSKIQHIYDNQDQAEKDILKDAKESKIIYVFAGVESFLTRTPISELNKLLITKNGDIQILFIAPSSSHVKKRTEEVMLPNTPAAVNAPHEIIRKLQEKNSNIKFFEHEEFIRNKFFIFDNVMYLGFRLKKDNSEKLQIWKIGKESHLYQAFFEQFNFYWEKYSSKSRPSSL
jgi:hypothetical protein